MLYRWATHHRIVERKTTEWILIDELGWAQERYKETWKNTRFFSFLVFSSLFFFRKKGIGNRYDMDESRCVEGLITHLVQFQVLYKD